MELIILGSGGAIPAPKPFCQCTICRKARRLGEPYKRNSSSLFIKDINGVIDCGEDIADSLNRRNIKQIDNLFITHWHPDHTLGLRAILQANLNWDTNTSSKPINIYIPKKSYAVLMERFSAIDYFINVQKAGTLHLVDDGDNFQLGDIKVSVVGYEGKGSDTCAYLMEHKGKKALYSPCDTASFTRYKDFINLNLLITECGVFSNYKSVISFDALMNRLREIKSKRTVITHIEEVEVSAYEKNFKTAKKQYSGVNFDFAYDGMKIRL